MENSDSVKKEWQLEDSEYIITNQVQDFYELKKQHLKNGTLFEDPDFPVSNYLSLILGGQVKWKRPKEIVKEPKFFVNKESRFDIKQGSLGDCWFLAAMANLTLSKLLFYQVVPGDQFFEEDYAGIFHFRFWQFGKWIDICVDDRLPTVDGELIYLSSSQSNEFWSPLMEKAYAKLYGSYKAIEGGCMCEALVDFTGGVVELYKLEGDTPVPTNLFEIMKKACQRNSLVCCSIVNSDFEKHGLFGGHAYSVTNVCCVDIAESEGSEKLQLVRVRNPWGTRHEWTGAWSDESTEWNSIPDLEKKKIGFTIDHNGEFWMSLEDFLQYFDEVEICHITPDSLISESEETEWVKKWEKSMFEGEWIQGKTAGGDPENLESFATNPQYRLAVTDPDEEDDVDTCTIVISVMQKNRRATLKDSLEIGLVIYRLEDPENLPKPLDADFFAKNEPCRALSKQEREVCGRFSLLPGEYCVIPYTHDPDQEEEFLLRVFSEKKNFMESWLF